MSVCTQYMSHEVQGKNQRSRCQGLSEKVCADMPQAVASRLNRNGDEPR